MTHTLLTERNCWWHTESTTSLLRVERTDIAFHNVSKWKVQIEITIHNLAHTPSTPTTMTLQAAVLGAFVPWQPLVTVDVPSLSPRESRTLTVEATRPELKTDGIFDRIPPETLIRSILHGEEDPTQRRSEKRSRAIGADDNDNDRAREWTRRSSVPGNVMLKFLQEFILSNSLSEELVLPYDPLDRLGQPNIHWAGNLNVLMNNIAVERHMAQSLRVYSDCTNLAVFFVGSARDEYKFEIAKSSADWEAQLCQRLSGDSQRTDPIIQESKWYGFGATQMILLAIRLPKKPSIGSPLNSVRYCTSVQTINVEVTQRSTNQIATVEFSLDPNAKPDVVFMRADIAD